MILSLIFYQNAYHFAKHMLSDLFQADWEDIGFLLSQHFFCFKSFCRHRHFFVMQYSCEQENSSFAMHLGA